MREKKANEKWNTQHQAFVYNYWRSSNSVNKSSDMFSRDVSFCFQLLGMIFACCLFCSIDVWRKEDVNQLIWESFNYTASSLTAFYSI